MKKLKEIYLINRSKIIIVVSAIMIITAVLEIYFSLAVRVTSNDECLWIPKKVSADSSAIFFNNVKVGGVTWNAGVRNGDELLGINHIMVPDPYTAQEILNKVKAGDYADYTIKKNGKIVETKVYVKKLIQIGYFADGVLALFQILIGFIVLMAKPDGRVQKLFYSIGVAFVLATTFIFVPQIFTQKFLIENSAWFTIAALAFSFGSIFTPFLFLAFFWTFPQPFRFMEKKWVRKTIFIIPTVLFVLSFLSTVYIFRYTKNYFDNFKTLQGYLGNILPYVHIVAVISLIINYFRLKSKEARKPVFIILIAYILAIAAVVYTSRIAPVISDTIYNSPEYYTPIILIIIFPIAFAYSILKYQLMDVSVVIKNTLMYGTATVSLAGIYFFIIYILGQTISEAIGTQFQAVIASLVFIVFAFVFQSAKDKYQDFLTAKFYPEQFAYQKVLVKFSNDVSTVVGLENILDSMKKTFVESLMINNFGILLRDKNDGEFNLERNLGISTEELKVKAQNIDQLIERKAVIQKQPVIDIAEFDSAFPEEADRLKSEGIYTVIPMVIKSKVIGLLLFGLKHSGSQFAGKDIELLYAAANQAAISIENARLYETEAEKLKIERDLSLARRIQQGLLPKCLPFLKGLDICGEMIPAMQVGGDYYDLIQVSDSKLFVVVGDVSGKGLAASLYMTKLQTMIQLACTDDKSPKQILTEINMKFYSSIERNSFVTITLALFDIEKNKVTFCRAGHMPVLTASNGIVNSYRTQGIGLGLEKGIVFDRTLIEEELVLKRGQIFAFFSDGITEAMNENLDLYGEDKLSELLKNKSDNTSVELMNDIWNALNVFRGKAEQNDDMTMVIVKVK